MTTSMDTDTFADQMLTRALGTAETLSIYVGDRLGWYQLLAAGPLTSRELAERSGTQERYAREWLEHQAVVGVLTVDDTVAGPLDRRYTLPAGA